MRRTIIDAPGAGGVRSSGGAIELGVVLTHQCRVAPSLVQRATRVAVRSARKHAPAFRYRLAQSGQAHSNVELSA